MKVILYLVFFVSFLYPSFYDFQKKKAIQRYFNTFSKYDHPLPKDTPIIEFVYCKIKSNCLNLSNIFLMKKIKQWEREFKFFIKNILLKEDIFNLNQECFSGEKAIEIFENVIFRYDEITDDHVEEQLEFINKKYDTSFTLDMIKKSRKISGIYDSIYLLLDIFKDSKDILRKGNILKKNRIDLFKNIVNLIAIIENAGLYEGQNIESLYRFGI